MAAGGPRDRPRGSPETARLRPRRESGCLVPRLRRLLRRDGQRQEPLCRGGPGGGAQGAAGQKIVGPRFWKPPRAGLRPRRVAARAASRRLPPHRQGDGELKNNSPSVGAGGGGGGG